MSVPTTSWDETTPSGSDALNAGDNRIRELKTQIREVIDVDHDFPSSGSASDNGQHKRCTFQEQADLGSGASGKTLLGGQTVGGKPELVYTDEDDNDVQITTLGGINAAKLKGVYQAPAAVSDLVNILPYIYPVGSIYINAGVATNPGTLFGFGTWVAYGAGKVMFGLDAGGDTSFDSLSDTGGAKTVTLTTNELPAHTHQVLTVNNNSGGSNSLIQASDGSGAAVNQTSQSTGSGAAFSILPPYVVAYFWKRTA
jgi:hypothetical protein